MNENNDDVNIIAVFVQKVFDEAGNGLVVDVSAHHYMSETHKTTL